MPYSKEKKDEDPIMKAVLDNSAKQHFEMYEEYNPLTREKEVWRKESPSTIQGKTIYQGEDHIEREHE